MPAEKVKIRSADNPNPWEHGIVYWDMAFEKQDGSIVTCSWGRKKRDGEPDSPQVGEELMGEFGYDKKGELKFKKGEAQSNGQGSFSTAAGTPSSGGTTYRYPPSPEEEWSIRRQHSQEMALRLIEIMGVGDADPAKVKELTLTLTDWFHADANKENMPPARPPLPKEGIEATNPAEPLDRPAEKEDLPF